MHTKSLFQGQNDWRSQEACLYLFNMLISDFQDREEAVPPEIAQAHVELINYSAGQCSPNTPTASAVKVLAICQPY